MPYTDRFTATDDLINHLVTVVPHIADPQLQANYAGFLSVSAVTVLELAVKDIFTDFSTGKHSSFGVFTANHFKRINGRILLEDLKKDHIKAFGQNYLDDFKTLLDAQENAVMTTLHQSIKESYGNLITCRHQYVHAGNMTSTFDEVKTNFGHSKTVLSCLDQAMR